MTLALELTGIRKSFDGVIALDGAVFAARAGEVHALLGENGAGKSSLMNVAAGLYAPDAGAIAIAGHPVALSGPAEARACGIGMVHQHFKLVKPFTIAENILLANPRPHYRSGIQEIRAVIRQKAGELGFNIDPERRVDTLAVAEQQQVEIVKVLVGGARILILDEPTAVLAPSEATDLLVMLRRFAADGGAVVLITHKMREALGTSDAITVLRAGRTVWSGAPDATNERELARAVVGEVESPAPRAAARPGAVRLSVRDLRAEGAGGAERVRGVTFEARAGELLGIAGVEGAGQQELLRALAGRLPATAGTVTAPARTAFVPEDRQRDALILPFTLTENVALKDAGAARGRVRWPRWRETTAALLQRFGVRPDDPDARASALSGGNQQRLVLARELGESPEAVIAENPTRGLDVAATAATHASLLAMRDAGAAVIVYSSDLDELLELADRMLVMHDGVATETPVQRDAIAVAMLGGAV